MSLFKRKSDKGAQDALTQEVKVTLADEPQPYVLAKRAEQAGIKHGDHAVVNLKNVQLAIEGGNGRDEPVLYFCPMKAIEVIETVSDGDGGTMPEEVTLPSTGLISKTKLVPGIYNINFATFHSNGSIMIGQTSSTEFELVEADSN
jgi:hypothetical protein